MQYRDRSFVLFALTCLVTTVKAQPTNSEEHTAELSPVVVVASKQNTPGVEVIDPKTAL
jgi:iron complex outermembrane recepter protein